MIKGAIFDVDGTLLESMQMWHNFASDFVTSFGKTPEIGLDDKVRYFTLRQTNEYFSSKYNLGDPDNLEKLSYKYTVDFYSNKVTAKPGAFDLLNSLQENHVPMVIATATYTELVSAGLERNNMLHFFKDIVTCGEIGKGKDSPDIFLKCSEILNLKPNEIWVFEDALHAIKTAKAAGFNVLSVYDETERDHINEIKEISNIYTNSLLNIKFETLNNLEIL